jgi:hypothetical protein
MFKKWLIRLTDNWRIDSYEDCVSDPSSNKMRRRLGQKLGSGLNPAPRSHQRVSHNYDDNRVITFKVYGANGGKIVETSRYDDKRDSENINLYIIDENEDFADSLAKIVTLEYLR